MVVLVIGDSDRRRKVSKGELGRSKAEARGATTKPLPLHLFIGLNFLVPFETSPRRFWESGGSRGNRKTIIRGKKFNTSVDVADGIGKLAMSSLSPIKLYFAPIDRLFLGLQESLKGFADSSCHCFLLWPLPQYSTHGIQNFGHLMSI